MELQANALGQVVHSPYAKRGFIGIPLATLREMTTSAVPNAAAHGGTLASNTTPIFNTVNGDTDSAQWINWAAADVDAVGFQCSLPPNLDTNDDMELHILCEMAGTTPWDSCTIASDTFFDVADTKVEDSVVCDDGTVTDRTLTIAAADIPDLAHTVSIELTPSAHANDALYVYALWLEFTVL